jgi:hypothetical protein
VVADGPRHAVRYCVICALVHAFLPCTTGWYGAGGVTVAGGVQALPPSPAEVVPPELPDVLPPVLPEPLPLPPLELPDVLLEKPPLELPDPLLPEPLLPESLPVELSSPALFVVLLTQPLAYTATGTARHAMSPRPTLYFTAILPWRSRTRGRALCPNRARRASTQTPLAMRHINVRGAAGRRAQLNWQRRPRQSAARLGPFPLSYWAEMREMRDLGGAPQT